MSTPLSPAPSGVRMFRGADPQARYADVLAWGTRLGFFVLVAAFVVYVFGLLDPHVPHADLSRIWTQPVGHYLRETGLPTGWGWIAHVLHGDSDMLNLAGIALLASCSVPALLAATVAFFRLGDRVFVALCVLEIAVLALAASNMFGAGH